MLEIVDRIPAPVLLKDWPGHYVQSKRKMSNWLASTPEGTIFELGTCTINKYLTSESCPCCGVSVKITYKGSMQEFLYDFDFVEVHAVEHSMKPSNGDGETARDIEDENNNDEQTN